MSLFYTVCIYGCILSFINVCHRLVLFYFIFFFQAEDGIRDRDVTGVQTCALPIFEISPNFLKQLKIAFSEIH